MISFVNTDQNLQKSFTAKENNWMYISLSWYISCREHWNKIYKILSWGEKYLSLPILKDLKYFFGKITKILIKGGYFQFTSWVGANNITINIHTSYILTIRALKVELLIHKLKYSPSIYRRERQYVLCPRSWWMSLRGVGCISVLSFNTHCCQCQFIWLNKYVLFKNIS